MRNPWALTGIRAFPLVALVEVVKLERMTLFSTVGDDTVMAPLTDETPTL